MRRTTSPQPDGTEFSGKVEKMSERAEATRRKLLEAAEEVFAELGFFRASVAEITRRANVAQGTFYIYFKAKEDIFRALVRTMSHDLRQELAMAVASITDRAEAERVGLETFLHFVTRRRNLYIIVRECEFVDPELHRWYYSRLAEGYMRGLRQAMARGQFRQLDAEAAAYALMGAFHMVGMRWALWEGRVPPREVVESVVSIVLHGLVPRPGEGDPGQPAG
ncbi:AcrR family transcriptional regulator [Symbiobacterium terraclitae]|uniref:AcrR family transcriptional regulator n=1 Tax=Symbiobacterium terraclitae TaxID=557451 RepID=A0ABS4JUS8_9FIRM|nr:TetR/AcrR family transcriptional regulator [Symbiobacterium terraclitae]MBP2019285.1 AcrR family transcriptional regulator [Symbiobacterium terraclitae]